MKIATALFAASLFAILNIASSAAVAQREFKFTDRNQDNYMLVLDHFIFIKGEWTGDANLTISQCSQSNCFHLSGPVKLPMNRSNGLQEGDFPVTGSPCDLHLVEVPKGGMDSGDYRITFVSSSQDGKGCASLPAGLAGFYQQVQ